MLRRRSIFLINKKFQLRYSFYVCSWLFALSLVYPMIIYSLFDFFLRSAEVSGNTDVAAKLQTMRKDVLLLLGGLQLLFLGVTFLISIFTSHRIAGPLYKLKKFFFEARDGIPQPKLQFRKGDHFTDLAEAYNELMQAIHAEREAKRGKAAMALAQVEKAMEQANPSVRGELEQAANLLRQLRNQPQTYGQPK